MERDLHRLFVGLFPAPPIAEALGSRIEKWKTELDSNSIKWVAQQKLHLTLCFLGSVGVSRIEELSSRLQEVGVGGPIHLELAGLGCFPNVRRPRVFWAGITGDIAALATLQARVQAACREFVEKPDDKPFSPHLTIARVRDVDRRTSSAIGRVLEGESAHGFGSWDAVDFRLVRSELGGEGSQYTVLKSLPLRPFTHPPS